jgi:hypothetical protein
VELADGVLVPLVREVLAPTVPAAAVDGVLVLLPLVRPVLFPVSGCGLTIFTSDSFNSTRTLPPPISS